MMKPLTTVLAAALLTTAAVAAEPPRRPNIVFVLADDLGFTDVGCYGSHYYETPQIDRMAAQGVRFTDGYTCGPNCQPTRAALMSGQYGPRTGVYTVGSIDRFDWRSRPLRPVDNVEKLPLTTVTLAGALRSSGYATGLFGKWHLGQDARHHPARRGFDEAIVSMGRHFEFVTAPHVEYPRGTYLADFLTAKAVEFITRHKDGPFFLCLHHFGVHAPHEAKPDLVKRFRAKPAAGGHHDPVYAAMIASIDESVGRVLRVLDELNLSDRTLVVFTSDNGGVGGYARAGIQKYNGVTDNAPLRGGKGMLYEGGVRVPYIFRWTGTIHPGTTCARPINSVDLYPTLLELTGAKRPENATLDGTSYAPLVSGARTMPERGPLFWHFPGYLGAAQGNWRTTPAGSIRDGDWKLLEFFETGKRELYNLRDDPGETIDLSRSMPDRVEALHAKLLAWRKTLSAPMPAPNKPRPTADRKSRTKKSRGEDESD
jgi:arylsulfatase A-like enzyme